MVKNNGMIEDLMKQINESMGDLGDLGEDSDMLEGMPTDLESDVQFESRMYFDADRAIEDAIRSELKDTVLEDKETDELRLEGVLAVDNLEIDDEKLKEYTETTLHPVIEALGVLNFDFEKGDPIVVDGSVYETALAIQMAKDKKYDVIREMLDITTDASETERFGELEDKELLETYIRSIHKDWELDENSSELVFENAKNYVSNGDTDRLMLNVFQATELFQEFNRDSGLTNVIAASKDAAKRRSGQLNAGLSGGKKTGVIDKLYGMVKSAREGIANLVKKYGDIEASKSILASKSGKLALGAAVLGLIATVVWRKTRSKDKVVSALRAQQSKCKLTANPDACKAALAKQITKWNVAKG